MCGFGITVSKNYSVDLAPVAYAARHRGPDEFRSISCRFAPNFYLNGFFNRLAIQDLRNSAGQPFEDESHILFFNGEIYNFLELRNELSCAGVSFETTGDTEVLFNVLKFYGPGGIKKLNGMFSIFWFSKADNKAILARDRYGIKPLYYYVDSLIFLCASECDTLAKLRGRAFEVDCDGVALYRGLQYVHNSKHVYKGVYSVEPGKIFELSRESGEFVLKSIDSFGCVDFSLDSPTVDEFKLDELLLNAVEKQLCADVDVGMLLSSGVDSSLILAAINKLDYSKPVNICSVGSMGGPSEVGIAHAFVQGFANPRFKFRQLELSESDIIDEFMTLYKYVDLPSGDNAILLNLAMYNKIKEYCSVVLGGDGADEVFSGYERYSAFVSNSYSYKSSFKFAKKIFKKLNYRTGYFRAISDDWCRYVAMLVAYGSDPDLLIEIMGPSIPNEVRNSKTSNIPQIIDLTSYLPDAMLFKVDRASMKYSVEARVPFLDNEFSQYGLQLSLGNSQQKNKAKLKSTLKRMAPHYHESEKKLGLNFNVEQFLHGKIKKIYCEYCHEFPVERLGINRSELISNFKKFYDGDRAYTYRNWIDLNLLHWAASKL